MSGLSVVHQDAVIVSLQRASTALAEAKTIQETKKILDVAAAAEIYARRQHLGEEAERIAIAIKIEALRKLGEMLQATPKNKGVRTVGGDSRSGGSVSAPPENDAPTLADLGLSKKESAVAQKLAWLSDEAFSQVRDGHTTISKAIAAVSESKRPAAKVEQSDAPDDARVDLVDELERAQAEIDELHGQLKAINADDPKAEALKWRKAYDHAVRQQADAMELSKRSTDREAWTMRQLQRCGKAVGQSDPSKIAAAVEAFVREHKRAAA